MTEKGPLLIRQANSDNGGGKSGGMTKEELEAWKKQEDERIKRESDEARRQIEREHRLKEWEKLNTRS